MTSQTYYGRVCEFGSHIGQGANFGTSGDLCSLSTNHHLLARSTPPPPTAVATAPVPSFVNNASTSASCTPTTAVLDDDTADGAVITMRGAHVGGCGVSEYESVKTATNDSGYYNIHTDNDNDACSTTSFSRGSSIAAANLGPSPTNPWMDVQSNAEEDLIVDGLIE